MEFLCSQCGACCRNVSHLDLPQDKNGICDHLDQESNLCTIYDNRPDICRVDTLYENYFKKFKMSKKEFYIRNTSVCHDLIDKENLDKKYKIDIAKYN